MKTVIIQSSIDIDILEICDIYLFYDRNCITVSEIFKSLSFKDPINYSQIKTDLIKKKLRKLFPIHKNNLKNCTYFKISKTYLNNHRNNSILRIRPFEDIKIQSYGINKEFFEKI